METKKVSLIRIMAEVAIFAAIGFVLDEIQGAISFSFVAGGSIGIAMVPILIIAFRRGAIPAILTGLIIGLLDLATKAYIIHPMQVFLDYVFPYAFAGLAGLLKPLFDNSPTDKSKIIWLICGTLVGGLAKFLSHYLSGVIFWNAQESFPWGLSYLKPEIFSLIYNIAYIGPSIILSELVLIFIYKRARKQIFIDNEKIAKEKELFNKEKIANITLSIVSFCGGTALLIIYLIKYITSHYYESYEAVNRSELYYSFNADCMVTAMFGLSLMIISGIHFYKTIKNKINYQKLSLLSSLIFIIPSLYFLSKILKMYIEKYGLVDYNTIIDNTYWIYFIIYLFVGISLIIISKLLKRKNHCNNSII